MCPPSDGDPGQPQQGGGQRRTDLRVCGPGILPGGHVAPHPTGPYAPHGLFGGSIPSGSARRGSLQQDRLS